MAIAVEKQHVPIFISSTYEDLIPYRDEVQRVIIRLEQGIKGMEYFGSSPKSSLETCLSQVEESKIFVGIVGMRYGSVDEETESSYSQLEYEKAVECGIPTLIYIIDENHPIPPKYVDVGDKAAKLSAFKESLKKKHTVSFFTSPSNLAEKISHDIVETLSSDALVKINIEKNDSSDFTSVFKKFVLRPIKYYGQEGTLKLKIVSDIVGGTLKEDLVRAFGLTLGDTLRVETEVLDSSLKAVNTRKVSLYAEQTAADWLMDIEKGSIIEAKVKLSYCIIKETQEYDGGRFLKNSSFIGLILQEGVS